MAPTSESGASETVQPGTPLWREFEHDVKDQIIAKYDPVTVNHDLTVTGCESGRPRQIDILVHGETAGVPIAVAIECKRNATREIGIGKIDEFIGKLHDLDVQVGIMYAFGGFDAGARARASGSRHPRVDLRDRRSVEDEVPVPPAILFDWNDTCGHMDELVQWETVSGTSTGTELRVGVCVSCGTNLGECSLCGTVTELDYNTDCDGWCGARWEVWFDRDHMPVFDWVAPPDEPIT